MNKKIIPIIIGIFLVAGIGALAFIFLNKIEPVGKCGDGVCDRKEIQEGLCLEDCKIYVDKYESCGQDNQGYCIDFRTKCEQGYEGIGPDKCRRGRSTECCVPVEKEETCSQLGGNICSSSQTCQGSWLDASDSERCCGGNCQTSVVKDSPFGAHGYYNIISDINDVGIKYKRNTAQEGIVWGLIEPDLDGNYDWSDFDSNLETAESLGLTLMVTIKSFHEDDQECHAGRYCIREGACRYNPCDWDKYEAFLNAMIERYKDRIKYWQIENEPKESGGYFSETPEGYAILLSTSKDIIKNVCSDCNVLIAGIWNDDGFEYYDEVFDYLKENNLQDSFDIFDMHTGANHDNIEEIYTKITTLLSKYGYLNKPIWSTEFGPLNPKGQVCEIPVDIGETLIKNFVVTLSIGFEKLFWRANECPSWIINKDGEKTATYHAYNTLIEKIEGFNSLEKLNDGQYKFIVNEKRVYVLWCNSGNCASPFEITGTVKVTDYLGNEEVKAANQIVLTQNPVFVEGK